MFIQRLITKSLADLQILDSFLFFVISIKHLLMFVLITPKFSRLSMVVFLSKTITTCPCHTIKSNGFTNDMISLIVLFSILTGFFQCKSCFVFLGVYP